MEVQKIGLIEAALLIYVSPQRLCCIQSKGNSGLREREISNVSFNVGM
jgi:hypothetical protein